MARPRPAEIFTHRARTAPNLRISFHTPLHVRVGSNYKRRPALQPLVAQREKKMCTYILHQSESDQCRFKYTSFFFEVSPVTNPATTARSYRGVSDLATRDGYHGVQLHSVRRAHHPYNEDSTRDARHGSSNRQALIVH